jgi:tRNA(Ile)-lysidine synthase TilS/MesJ
VIRALDKKSFSPWRKALIELLDEGVLNADQLARDLTNWCSDSDIKEFIQQHELPIAEDPLTHDEDGDGTPDLR